MDFIQPNWPAPSNIKAYTTLRHTLPNSEINFKNEEARQQLQTYFNLPNDPIWINQTHSIIAVEANQENKNNIADASYTTKSHQICVVLTADCLPILICNKQGTQIAAIHAGWRGLAGGIINTTLQQLNLNASDALIWLGPAIGPQKFEVGGDVYTAFINKNREAEAAFKPISEEKWLANLYELAKIQFRQQGIHEIYGGEYCTYTQSDLFFSYRRDHGQTGRLASLIWIDN